MKAFISVLIYYLSLLQTTSADRLMCPEHEILQQCKSPWEPTCSRPYPQYPPRANFFNCLPGCSCEPGSVRDESTGKCTPRKRCSQECPEGEIPNMDGRCEPTCQGHGQNRFQCPGQQRNCLCRQGLFRDVDSGRCVQPQACPKECGINEQRFKCVSKSCRRTCQNRNSPDVDCSGDCEPGCDCKEGYIWDEYCKQCVPEDDCPEECGENEVYERCTNIKCRKTCKHPNGTDNCSKICVPGCACKEGFVYDEVQRKCVLLQDCGRECGPNAIWQTCSGVGCRETCQRRKPRHCDDCKPGCSCIDGHLWEETSKKCVPKWLCPEVCGDHEEWCDYVADDAPTCQSLLEPTCSRCNSPSMVSVRPGCICEKGYIWDQSSEACITIEECLTKGGIVTTETSSTDKTTTAIITTDKPSSTTIETTSTEPNTTTKESTSTSTSIETTSVSSSTDNSTGESTTSGTNTTDVSGSTSEGTTHAGGTSESSGTSEHSNSSTPSSVSSSSSSSSSSHEETTHAGGGGGGDATTEPAKR